MKPWWAEGVYQFVNKHLKPNSKIFEWGSGASTIILSKKHDMISVENDLKWYNKIKSECPAKLLYFPDCGPTNNDPNDIYGYSSNSLLFNKKNFTNYVKSIDNYKLFDLIIVDGRSRTSCLAHAIDHVAQNGILLLDDPWRPHYKPGIDMIPSNWNKMEFKSVEHKTDIWIKTTAK